MKNKSIGFIGGGRITKVFLQAFKNAGVMFNEISVFDPNPEALVKLKSVFPDIVTASDSVEISSKSDLVVLAVHTPLILEVLIKIKPYLNEKAMVVSLAPKITIDKITAALDGFQSIARVNPSANGVINQGINPVFFSETISSSDKEDLLSLFQLLGRTFEVPEPKLEAYALISAMGPTYFGFQLQHLKTLGQSYGLDENEAKDVIAEMIRGTVNTLFYSDMSPDEVMDLVPAKPIGEYEETIKTFYSEKLNGIYNKIKS